MIKRCASSFKNSSGKGQYAQQFHLTHGQVQTHFNALYNLSNDFSLFINWLASLMGQSGATITSNCVWCCNFSYLLLSWNFIWQIDAKTTLYSEFSSLKWMLLNIHEWERWIYNYKILTLFRFLKFCTVTLPIYLLSSRPRVYIL